MGKCVLATATQGCQVSHDVGGGVRLMLIAMSSPIGWACAAGMDRHLKFGRALEPATYARIRRQMLVRHLKWDAQVGDENVLLDQPLILDHKTWRDLSSAAERMANEIAGVERELLQRPDLQAAIGVPRGLRSVLRDWAGVEAAGMPRILRFDFHPTTDGWKASEVNSDVPGGFTEASNFTGLVADHYPGARPSGNPLESWVRAIASIPNADRVGILYAPGYLEDQQIASLLGNEIARAGCRVDFAQQPKDFAWSGRKATLHGHEIDVIVRFYQGEWLARLPRRSGWPSLFSPGQTGVINPAPCVLSESKRMPLIWERICAQTPTLRAMFPECREPGEVDSSSGEWVFKAAYSNNGDAVVIPGVTPRDVFRRFRRTVRWHSRGWVAQRRFEPLPIENAAGMPLYPCIGVYTIIGRCAGSYVRLSRGPLVDYRAIEAALLVSESEED